MSKKRILLINEFSGLNTGYSTYGLEIMKRLYASDQYVLAELAQYCKADDQRILDIPWAVYPNLPMTEEEQNQYNSNPLNQFGAWKFEKACLDFKPDIVMCFEDHWYQTFILKSPFRRLFKYVLMPTCDASPQNEGWIADYCTADAVLAYNDWSLNVLSQQSGGDMPLRGTASPGADIDNFKPVQNKSALKQQMGLPADCFVVGMVNRNQKRKLFDDLIKAFALFVQTGPEELVGKTYLYLHTAMPDIGWDVFKIALENHISHRILYTHSCKACGSSYPSFCRDLRTFCINCGRDTVSTPNSQFGVNKQVMSQIYNLFDVYVQYCNSEGFGIAQAEAAACGVPVFATDYSAMSDVVRKLKGTPIKVKALSREAETGCYRALPDNENFVEKLINFLSLPEALRKKKGYEARLAVEKHYTYDKAAAKWMEVFNSLDCPSHDQTWLSPPRFHQINTDIPHHISIDDWVNLLLIRVAGRPDLVNSYITHKLAKDLTSGITSGNLGGTYLNDAEGIGFMRQHLIFNKEKAIEEMVKWAEFNNYWEGERTKLVQSKHQ